MAEGRYANIIIDISHEKVDRTFQYKIPASLAGVLEPGSSVTVPFGQGNRLRQGYVIEVTDRAEFPPEKMKEVAGISKGGVSVEADAVKLAPYHLWGGQEITGILDEADLRIHHDCGTKDSSSCKTGDEACPKEKDCKKHDKGRGALRSFGEYS